MTLERIERVVDDEIDPTAARPGAAAELPAPFPIGFSEADGPPAVPWSEAIFAAAKRHGLNPALVAAVARVESAFDPRAVSSKGARGLMQLMPATGRRFGLRPHELFDPVKNLDAGVRYLAWLAARFDGDLARVLAGYHAGEGAVERFGGVPPYRETRAYLRSVYARLGLSASAAPAP
ncbi:MAG: lytic transglycosylase domain-containing protein [Thermoanaerobaculia bacterium]|nr:MAG: lytic transglycosylase domain-containing protein [Thermoanaerobaculia bacterium]